MKEVTLNADQYTNVAHPACAMASLTKLDDLRVTVRVLDKLEEHGAKTPTGAWVLIETTQKFQFEEDECKHLAKRIVEFLPRAQVHQLRQAPDVIDQLEAKVTA